MSQPFASAAEAAAAWWAAQIGAPTYRMVSGEEPLKEITDAAFTSVLMNKLAAGHPVTPEQGDKFATRSARGPASSSAWAGTPAHAQ